MKKIERKLISKYLNDDCTEEEKKRVLRWLNTTEGFTSLERLLDSDIRDLHNEDNFTYNYSTRPHSERLISAIKSNISDDQSGKKHDKKFSKRDYTLPFIKLAAIFVVFLFSLFIYLTAYVAPS